MRGCTHFPEIHPDLVSISRGSRTKEKTRAVRESPRGFKGIQLTRETTRVLGGGGRCWNNHRSHFYTKELGREIKHAGAKVLFLKNSSLERANVCFNGALIHPDVVGADWGE